VKHGCVYGSGYRAYIRDAHSAIEYNIREANSGVEFFFQLIPAKFFSFTPKSATDMEICEQ
jgi:hypothetical protein